MRECQNTSEQSEKQEPTDIQGLEAVDLRTRNQTLGMEIEQIVGNRCVPGGFLQKIKENRNTTVIYYSCKVQAPRNETVGAWEALSNTNLNAPLLRKMVPCTKQRPLGGVEKLVMKQCTKSDTEVIRSTLIPLKLPIKRTVIKIPAKISDAGEIGFSHAHWKGRGLDKRIKVGGAYKSI